MKTLLRRLVTLLFILLFTSETVKAFPDPDSINALPTIQLVSPNGGEELTGLSLHVVKWSGTNLNIFYAPKIEISLDGGNTWTPDSFWYIINMSDYGGSAYHLLPPTLSSQVKIKLSDYYNPGIFDVSDNNFSITTSQQLLVIINNFYFSRITSDSRIDIAAMTNEIFDEDYFTFSVTYDEGLNWEVVKQNVKMGLNVPGPVYWEIPEDIYGTCQLKVQSESVPERNGTSVCFTIHEKPEIEISVNYPQNLVHTDTTFVIDYNKIDEDYLYDAYLLYISKDKGITWEYIKTLAMEANRGNFQLNSPMQETDSCLFKVIDAINGNSSDMTDYVSFRNFPATPICQVTIDPSTKKNLIKWSKPESGYISEYVIFRETYETNVYEEIARIPKNNVAEFVDLNSNPDERAYRYKLSYIDSENRIYPLSSPHQTTHLSVYKSSIKGYNLIWSNYVGADIETYTIYRGTTEANLSEIEKVSGNNSSYTDLDSPSGTLYYRIQASGKSDCLGLGDFSSYSNIAGESSLAINESNIKEPFKFYPNPAEDNLFLSFDKPVKDLFVRISDMSGRLVYSRQFTSSESFTTEIDLSQINNGLYLLRVDTNAFSTTNKLVINK